VLNFLRAVSGVSVAGKTCAAGQARRRTNC
jgi:hypothetical protein